MEISISDNIISISYKLHRHLHRFVLTMVIQYSISRTHRVGRRQVSGRGPTFRITRGSFFAIAAAGVVSGVDSGDDDDAAASAAASGAVATWPA